MTNRFNNSIKVGILGGGQLGRMLIQAAIDLDLNIHILDPDSDAPCRHLMLIYRNQLGRMVPSFNGVAEPAPSILIVKVI